MKFKLGVYGTLRKNMGLNMLSPDDYIETRVVPGFDMYSLGAYPAVVRSNSILASITCEIYNVSKDVLDSIDEIEFGAGYTRESDDDFFIYVMPEKNINKNRFLGVTKVHSGDWAKYIAAKNFDFVLNILSGYGFSIDVNPVEHFYDEKTSKQIFPDVIITGSSCVELPGIKPIEDDIYFVVDDNVKRKYPHINLCSYQDIINLRCNF